MKVDNHDIAKAIKYNPPEGKLISDPKALIAINKYGNNAIFVYWGDELKDEGPATDPVGTAADESIASCNKRAGCWAREIPASDEIGHIGFGVHANDYDRTDALTAGDDKSVQWMNVISSKTLSSYPTKVCRPCLMNLPLRFGGK